MDLEKAKSFCKEYDAHRTRLAVCISVLVSTDDSDERIILEDWIANLRTWLSEREETYNLVKELL